MKTNNLSGESRWLWASILLSWTFLATLTACSGDTASPGVDDAQSPDVTDLDGIDFDTVAPDGGDPLDVATDPPDLPNLDADDAADVTNIPDAADSGIGTDIDVEADADDAGSTPDAFTPNPCGGSSILLVGGLVAEPGDACGACGDGVQVCDGPEALRCARARDANVCGGCEPLPATPGEACGPCSDGRWACTPEGGLTCEAATELNGCGGCGELDGEPAWRCETETSDGTWTCASPSVAVCQVGGRNACGGELALASRLGARCGPCGRGRTVCDGADQVRCDTSTAATNTCGGCSVLAGEPGTECGSCGGEWACDASGESVTCIETLNACGGCTPLVGQPGDPCADPDDGQLACLGTDELFCAPRSTNACGGTAELSAAIGSRCGPCDDGVVTCAGLDAIACAGVRPENPCGGCGILDGAPGERCAPGAVWTCTPDGVVSCAVPEPNACGGVGALSASPGTACADCDLQRWVCASAETLVCIGGENLCGGCSRLDAVPGTACGTCDSGRWQCAPGDDERVVCAGNLGDAAFRTLYEDNDGDGFGDPARPTIACAESDGLVDNRDDCDDTNEALTTASTCLGRITGTVRFNTDGTSDFASVSLVAESTTPPVRRCTGVTNPVGAYEISGCDPGIYNVSASHPDYRTATLPNVQVLRGAATANVDFLLDPIATGVPADIRYVAGGSNGADPAQTGVVGAASAVLTVRVLDRVGLPVPSAAIRFSIDGPDLLGARMQQADVVTDSSGTASNVFVLGRTAGRYQVRVSVVGLSGDFVDYFFDAVADVPAAITLTAGASQTGQVGQGVASPVAVLVTDRFANPTPSVLVRFVPTLDGMATPSEFLTGTDGRASTLWTLGSVAGSQTLTISSGTATAQATALADHGPATAITIESGNRQNGINTATLAQPLVVRVRDAFDNPVDAVPVAWSVTSGTGTLDPTVPVPTNTAGLASVRLTPTSLGAVRINASSAGLSAATFDINSLTGPPNRLEAVSGNEQTGIVGTLLPQPLVVRAVDALGNPTAGIFLEATALANEGTPGTLSATELETGADGTASLGWTLGTRAGAAVQTVLVETPSYPVAPLTFSVVARPGAVTSLEIVSGDNQVERFGATLPEPLVVRATDAFGNFADGASVVWSGPSGATFAPAVSTVGLDGLAQTEVTLSPDPTQTVQSLEARSDAVVATFNAEARGFGIDRVEPERWLNPVIPGSLPEIITLYGGGFEPGMTVVIQREDGEELEITPTLVESGRIQFMGVELTEAFLGMESQSLGVRVDSGTVVGGEFEVALLGFVRVPAGTFLQGTPGDTGSERPYLATISRDYLLFATETTQGHWKAATAGTNPSCYQSMGQTNCSTAGANDDGPVERIDRYSAMAYANWLSAARGWAQCYELIGCEDQEAGWYDGVHTGCTEFIFAGPSCTGFRLPTESEWELAARAGTTTTYSWGDSADPTVIGEYAWYEHNSAGTTHPVGLKLPNEYGLYDMSGNVAEIVTDWASFYPDDAAIDFVAPFNSMYGYRGGWFSGNSDVLRSSSRFFADGPGRGQAFGFRLAYTATE